MSTTPGAVTGARQHPHPVPTTYPLMLRTWRYRWWQPVVGLALLLVGELLVVPVVLIPVLAAGIAIQGGDVVHDLSDAINNQVVTPASMLYLNLLLAGLIVVAWLLVRFLHKLRFRWLVSVRPGFRWRFFFACMGLSLVALLAQLIVGSFLPSDPNGLSSHPNPVTGKLVALGLVILFTTPLQAMGEEFGFRGYALQAFGSLTKSPWFAIVLSAALFTAAHGTQNIPLLADRFAFGLLAGYLVYRTGGLEAGIALHIWNNLLAFGFALFFGDVQASLTATHASWWNLPLTVVQNGSYLLLVLYLARRMGLDNHTRPPVLEESAAPV